MICKSGEVIFDECHGAAKDNIHRWYSSTKPITSVALMMLYEEGRFQLTDPVWLYFGPAWKRENMRVYVSGGVDNMVTEECKRSITVQHLMSHMSGLTYNFDEHGKVDPVSGLYNRTNACDMVGKKLSEFVKSMATMPLLFQPG